ncbi:MAG: hypothetical protein ACRDTA_06445 [Pseudonocardiaceae bacterium]
MTRHGSTVSCYAPDSDPAASTTATSRTGAPLHLSTRTVAWLADHPAARQLVGSVWDKLTCATSRCCFGWR